MELTYTATPDQMLHVFRKLSLAINEVLTRKTQSPSHTFLVCVVIPLCFLHGHVPRRRAQYRHADAFHTDSLEGPERGPAAARDREGWRLACV